MIRDVRRAGRAPVGPRVRHSETNRWYIAVPGSERAWCHREAGSHRFGRRFRHSLATVEATRLQTAGHHVAHDQHSAGNPASANDRRTRETPLSPVTDVTSPGPAANDLGGPTCSTRARRCPVSTGGCSRRGTGSSTLCLRARAGSAAFGAPLRMAGGPRNSDESAARYKFGRRREGSADPAEKRGETRARRPDPRDRSRVAVAGSRPGKSGGRSAEGPLRDDVCRVQPRSVSTE